MDADLDVALDALGDAARRRIVGKLASRPLDVGTLAAGMPIGRAAVSMHLRVLKAAGLVEDRAEANRRVYHLRPDTLQRLRDHLDWYWDRALAAYTLAAGGVPPEERMTEQPEIAVRKTVRVDAPLGAAFDTFVDMDWWPVGTHHIATQPGHAAVLEPFAGGRWYERAADGAETDWGTVLAWQPPYRLLLTWQVSPAWTFVADPRQGSEIEVTFTPEGPYVTRIDLTHRHLERYGPDTERMRRILDEKGGEPLRSYAGHMAAIARQGARP